MGMRGRWRVCAEPARANLSGRALCDVCHSRRVVGYGRAACRSRRCLGRGHHLGAVGFPLLRSGWRVRPGDGDPDPGCGSHDGSSVQQRPVGGHGAGIRRRAGRSGHRHLHYRHERRGAADHRPDHRRHPECPPHREPFGQRGDPVGTVSVVGVGDPGQRHRRQRSDRAGRLQRRHERGDRPTVQQRPGRGSKFQQRRSSTAVRPATRSPSPPPRSAPAQR
jgi:hypothetical protein